MVTEKHEYKHSVSCSTELKKNIGREDGRFGSESIGMTSYLTVKFDDPKDAMELLGSGELVDVIEKVRHITVTDVSRNVQVEYIQGVPDFETAEEFVEDPNSDSAKAEKMIKEEEGEKEQWEATCEKCAKKYMRDYKPVEKKFRKAPYLCPDCRSH